MDITLRVIFAAFGRVSGCAASLEVIHEGKGGVDSFPSSSSSGGLRDRIWNEVEVRFYTTSAYSGYKFNTREVRYSHERVV